MHRLSSLIYLVLFCSVVFAQSPHGDNFDIDCENCHNTESWKINPDSINFDHTSTGFELMGQHQKISCSGCHSTLEFSKVKKECYQCHTDIHQQTVGMDCANCHSTFSWVIPDIKQIHDITEFPLVGVHRIADCEDCHQNVSILRFDPVQAECFACHKKDYYGTKNPDHAKSGISTDCEQCHNLYSYEWSQGTFVHDFFPLVGGHSNVDCADCHSGNNFTAVNNECYSCHANNYNSVSDPDHRALGFSTDCSICHSLSPGWQPAKMENHDQFFALTGAHARIASDCKSCHINSYVNTPEQCAGCHISDYNSTTDPNHISAGFSQECETCHTTNAWQPAVFDHDASFFPIYSGSHNNQWNNCSDCHTNQNNFAVFECITCHEHNKTETDSHHAGMAGYQYVSTACLACHPTGSSEGFDHSATAFPLTGAHASAACSDCHSTGFSNMSIECFSCHESNYNSTTAPAHLANNFPHECETCHTTSVWQPSIFDHNSTQFPLTGAHATIDCANCHTSGYAGINTDCYSCHKSNYDATADPSHIGAGFPTDCAQCHTTTAWEPANFEHDASYFPIYSGSHNNQWDNCSDCHTNQSNFAIFECITCHEHNKSETDSHHNGINGYQYLSSACFACHPDGRSEGFDHSSTAFPLTGAHTTVTCNDCHSTGFSNMSVECFSCHESNYNSATEPAHLANNFSHECQTCHTTSVWQPSTFDHNSTQFPLTGAHTSVDCSGCHSSGFAGTSPDCYNCHQDNFNTTTDPNHIAANFPTHCLQCHTTSAWKPATFDHDASYFPIYSGKHNNQWDNCSDCHTNQSNLAVFECITCHEHNQSDMDSKHSGINGYQYVSTACLGCHPTGNEADGFDHSTTAFPLTGAHTTAVCSDCHESGFTNMSTDCYSCHQNNFNTATNPVHLSAGFPTECVQCHTTNGWSPSSFNHDSQNFPIYSGRHRSEWNTCSQCHENQSNFGDFTCLTCHEHSQSRMDSEHAGRNGYSYDSQACYNCHPTGNGD